MGRALGPLVLLGFAFLVWFERFLPGADKFHQEVGETTVLRVVVGFLCVIVLGLLLERRRQHQMFAHIKAMLQELRRGGPPAEQSEAKAKEATSILLAALASSDANVRKNVVQNLERITGQQFGEDVERWRAYLATPRAKS